MEYLRTHVKLVWGVDPGFRTVRVYRPDQEPVMFNRRQILTADDILPGFEVAVADLFPNWSAEKVGNPDDEEREMIVYNLARARCC